MYEPFEALMQDALGDTHIDVIEVNGDMTICMPDDPIYITKQQAKQFFGLVEAKE